jgi:hypothetical protein
VRESRESMGDTEIVRNTNDIKVLCTSKGVCDII